MKRKHFEIHTSPKDGLHYVTIHGGNGERVFTSEGLKDIRDARKAVAFGRSLTPQTPLEDFSNSNPSEVHA